MIVMTAVDNDSESSVSNVFEKHPLALNCDAYWYI